MSEHPIPRPWLDVSPEPAHGPSPFTPRRQDVLSLFHDALDHNRNQAAIHYFDQTLDYGQLDAYSTRFALKLLDLGIKKGDRVALYMQNIPQFNICALGIWKAGALGVTINPMNRARELRALLEDSSSRVLVMQKGLYDSVAKEVLQDFPDVVPIVTSAKDFQSRNDKRVISADDDVSTEGGLLLNDILFNTDSEGTANSLRHTADPDEPAMLVYTSGTTGTPKGAIITHANVAIDAELMRQWMGVSQGGAIVGLAPLFHITGLVANIALPYACFSAVILTTRFHPAVLADAIEEYRGEFIIGAITAFNALMNHPGVKPGQLRSLDKIYTGGAPVPAAIAHEFERKFACPIRSTYGLTESTALALSVPPDMSTPADKNGALSVGIPVFRTDAYIAGDDGSVQPPGSVGEIMLRGPQIVPGYWNKPEETAATFHNGFLKTGDVGYMNDAGWFFIVDRKKDMINASGYKVWPKEVEDVLYSHPAVLEAAVIGVPDDYRGETVKAVISLKPDARVQPTEIIDYCRERLAAYKYPRTVEILEELPKTATGKILRRALR